jgi:murein DD-endopeptidase MepM/ murein hydrolase activator NlpD
VRLFVIFGALAIFAGALAFTYFSSTKPAVAVSTPKGVIGPGSAVEVRVDNPHGLRSLWVYLEQDGPRERGWGFDSGDRPWPLRASSDAPEQHRVVVSLGQDSTLKTGPARLVAEAVSNDLRGLLGVATVNVKVDRRPPTLSVDGEQHYVNTGGAELVTFTVSGAWNEAGVRVGKYTFRSFELPGAGDPNRRFAFFAFPHDLPQDTVPVVYARNAAGAEATGKFWFKLFPKPVRKRDLHLDRPFVEKAIQEVDPGAGGSLVDRFLEINRRIRSENNRQLAALRLQTEERVLWTPPFEQLANSKVESVFADVRTYYWEQRMVDQQVHLGFDLSVTANVPVAAANSGKVVFAGRLGIYGNCVVLDHGYGLQSIYAHLSAIEVRAGQMLKRREILGRSGASGLAGGDHLHFSMQVDGVQVNPVEWWDAHWIRDRIASKLPLPQ